MRILIPSSVAAEVAHALSNYHTHATLENCFQRAGVGGDPPVGNKLQKTSDYLRRVNEDEMLEPLAVLGLILEEFMTKRVFYEEPESTQIARARVEKALADHGLSYQDGGRILGRFAAPTRTLGDKLRSRDLPALDVEFRRALDSVERDPGSAVRPVRFLRPLSRSTLNPKG